MMGRVEGGRPALKSLRARHRGSPVSIRSPRSTSSSSTPTRPGLFTVDVETRERAEAIVARFGAPGTR